MVSEDTILGYVSLFESGSADEDVNAQACYCHGTRLAENTESEEGSGTHACYCHGTSMD